MNDWLAHWLDKDGAELRRWLGGYLPEPVRDLTKQPPLWVVEIVAATAAIVMLLILLLAIVAAMGVAYRFLRKPAKTVVTKFRPDEPATKGDVAALTEQIRIMLDRQVPPGTPAPPPDVRERRDAAVAEIATQGTPASAEAAREIAAGDVSGAVATLLRDARADKSAAAEKYRRVSALVREFDTKTARDAYEDAFKLEPGDFWTCVELSRLRATGGDTSGALTAAKASVLAANDDRDRSVAYSDIGNLQVAQGNLTGALASF